jgi:hypothetical protein
MTNDELKLLSCVTRIRGHMFERLTEIPEELWPHLIKALRSDIDHVEHVITGVHPQERPEWAR